MAPCVSLSNSVIRYSLTQILKISEILQTFQGYHKDCQYLLEYVIIIDQLFMVVEKLAMKEMKSETFDFSRENLPAAQIGCEVEII